MGKSSGILYDKFTQIKMLILFVMSRLLRSVPMEVLTELAMCDERITYFDVTECIEKLVKTKHLSVDNGQYKLTAKGLRNSKILEEDLPYSVRVRAEEAATRINGILARDSLIKTRRAATSQGGWNVELSLSDGMGEILSIGLYTAGEQQAERLEKGFRNNAESLYHSIVELILNPKK